MSASRPSEESASAETTCHAAIQDILHFPVQPLVPTLTTPWVAIPHPGCRVECTSPNRTVPRGCPHSSSSISLDIYAALESEVASHTAYARALLTTSRSFLDLFESVGNLLGAELGLSTNEISLPFWAQRIALYLVQIFGEHVRETKRCWRPE